MPEMMPSSESGPKIDQYFTICSKQAEHSK